MPQLVCRDLSLGYEGNVIAGNIEFSVNSRDYLCIVGTNGAGKSTLIKTLLGMLHPLSGTVELGDGLHRNEIGYLPQQTDAQKDFPASVREIVLSGCLNKCRMRPFYGKSEKKLAAEAMEKLGISALASKCYRELSGGQQQRVLLARALCSAGKMILLDEPVSGLDPSAAQEMYDIIAKLNRDEKITVIMVTHDLPAAMKYAGKILHLGHTMKFFGAAEEYPSTEAYRELSANPGECHP